MKIFNEKKNKYFAIARKLINRSLNETTTVEDVKTILSNEGFIEYDYDFKNALIGNASTTFDGMQLFESDGDEITPKVCEPIPVLLTTVEQEWLKTIVSDNRIHNFISENTLSKLCNKLNAENVTSENSSETFQMVLKAIKENLWIVCDNNTSSGKVYSNIVVAPFKIEFSSYLDTFWLIGYIPADNKLVKMQIERMTINTLVEPTEKLDFESISQKYIKSNPIVLELTEERGALERALHMFSSYKKDGFYDSATKVHHLKIQYYSFDEKELIKNIISLGPYVKVIEPQYIVEKIKSILNLQKKCFNESSHSFFNDIFYSGVYNEDTTSEGELLWD